MKKRIDLAIAALVLALAVFGAIAYRSTRSNREVAPRLVVPRLAGWSYGPPPQQSGSRRPRPADLRRILEQASEHSAHRAAAITSLLTGEAGRAVTKLGAIAANGRSAEAWNDLAAALLVRAEELDEGSLIIDALAASGRALEIDPELGAARFNRALALEELGLVRHARSEWIEYLRRDQTSPWADEALRRLNTLRIRSYGREARAAFAAARAGFRRNDESLGQLVRQYPAYFRRATESEVLAAWGVATLKGQHAVAARELEFARAVGGHLRTAIGENLLSDAVAAIDGPASRDVLVHAHVAYNDARRIYSEGNAVAAEPKLREAAELFARGSSPMTFVARYYTGGALRTQSRLAEASTALEALERERLDRRGYPSIAAQLGWELGGCLLERGSISDAIDVFSRSRRGMERVGEIESAAWMDAFLANALDFAGDHSAAWRVRRRALAALTRAGSEQRALVALQSAATGAVHAREWDRGRTLLELTASGASELQLAAVAAHAFTQLALVKVRQQNASAASKDIELARRWVADLRDPSLRARADADLAVAEGVVRAATEPERALTSFDRAVDFYVRAGRRVDLPRTYLERARAARRAGRIRDARQDLEKGLEVVATERAALRELDQRASLVAAAEELFEEAIDLAMMDRDVESAFRLAEASKGRMLTDLFELGSEAANAEVTPMTLREIQTSLAVDAAIVAYVALPKRLITFVIRRDGIQAQATDVSRGTLASVIAQFANAVHANDFGMLSRSAAAEGLLIGRSRAALAGARHIAFVTDRFTSGVPFSALYDAARRRLLIEDASIVTAPGATLLVTASRRAASSRRESLLAIGANLFDTVSHPRLPGLPNASREAEQIAEMYERATLVTSTRATTRIAQTLGTYDVVHFAGHALPNRDRVTRSALLLAPAGEGDDGELRLHDIARLRMRETALVVLASCQSGKEVARSDGAENLALGFIAAGVPMVVANLWELDDRVSQKLMTGLHERLRRNDTPARAIQVLAREHIRDRSGNIRTPLRWAGFVVVGGSPELIAEERGAS